MAAFCARSITCAGIAEPAFAANRRADFAGPIRCPYHGWSYGLDGRLVGAPHMDDSFRREEYPLHSVQADEWDGFVFLNLDPYHLRPTRSRSRFN